MKTMRKLYDQAMEELDGVMEYSECSMMYAQIDPELSKLYFQIENFPGGILGRTTWVLPESPFAWKTRYIIGSQPRKRKEIGNG